MFEVLKIAYRNLKKRRLRTVLTIFAVSLGVSIMVGVNMGTDMIGSSIKGTLNKNLGDIDVSVEFYGTENYQTIKSIFSTYDVEYLESWVPRYVDYKYDISFDGITSHSWEYMLRARIVGLDVSLEQEENFGRGRVIEVHPSFSESLVGKLISPDFFLKPENNITRPVAVTRNFLEYNNLNDNISAGDVLRIMNDYWHPEFPLSTWDNPSTWPNFTVVAIIDDFGKMGAESLEPRSNNFLFMDLDDMWEYVANNPSLNQPINYIMAHSLKDSQVTELSEDLEDLLEDETPLSVYASTPKKDYLESFSQGSNIIRVAFSIFAAISLIVCGVLIKNLFETAKQTDIHEIGILKGIGFNHRFITGIYLNQIFIISSIGIMLSFAIGTTFSYAFVKILSKSTLARDVLDITFDISIVVSITPLTLLIAFTVGYSVPYLFGLIPILQTARISVVKAIHSRSSSSQQPLKKSIGMNVLMLLFGTLFVVGGTFLASEGISRLLATTFASTSSVAIPGAMIIFGIVGFLFGIILLAIFTLPVLTKGFSFLFLLPLERSLKQICYRNLMRNKRRTTNTFLMMAIGLSFTVSVTTITNSISAGTYPGYKTLIGGDIQLTPPYMFGIEEGFTPEFLDELTNLSLITDGTLYRVSVDTTRLSSTYDIFGNKVDDFGYFQEDFPDYREYISIGMVNGESYYNVNRDAILRLNKPYGQTNEEIFDKLDQEPSIILQSELKNKIDKKIGDKITLKMEGISIDLTVIAFADVLPGFPWTYNLGAFGGYAPDPNEEDLCGMVSWNTYFTMVDNLFKNIDLIVKNRFWQEGLTYVDDPAHKIWGITGFPINITSTINLLNTYLSNSTILNATFPTSNFYPIPLEYYNERPFDYHQDPSQMSDILFDREWNQMNTTITGIDYSGTYEYGAPRIMHVNASVPIGWQSSVENILKWYDSQPGVNACIVNEILVEKNADTFEDYLDRESIYSVYEFNVGDKISIPINASITHNFTVVATVESNWNYQFSYLDQNVSSPWIINPKTVNFDAYHENQSFSGGMENFADVFYAESNTFFTSRERFNAVFGDILQEIQNFGDVEILPGLNISSLTLFNETLKYAGNLDDYSNLMYLKLDDALNASEIEANLETLFATTPGFENFTVLNPKETFFDLLRLNTGIAFLGADRDKLVSAVDQIKALYESKGLYFSEYYVEYYGKDSYGISYQTLIQSILEIITTVFNMVLVFSIIISLVGLSISMLISIHQRRRELGTLRSIGYSKKKILYLIYGENMTLGLLGIIIGLIAGLVTANVMIAQVPFTVVLPILFSPPISAYVTNSIIIFLISLTASIVPAYRSMNLDIAKVLKSGE
ncbi:MAG: FtsX-like permease family protein [Promethearchaeota archaeon]